MLQCFCKDALQTIQIDKKRSDVAKESDIIFLADQLGDRKMMFTTKDRKYEKVVMRVEQKKQKILLRKQNEKNRVMESNNNDMTVELDADWEDLEVENEDEDSFKSPMKKKARFIPVGGMRKRARKIKGRTISLDVPVDIIQQTAVDAARLQLSPTQHQGIIAAVINVSGGTVNEFPLSDSSARRDIKNALKEKKH